MSLEAASYDSARWRPWCDGRMVIDIGMTASPRPCSTENWSPVIEHGEDNESGIRTCLRQR